MERDQEDSPRPEALKLQHYTILDYSVRSTMDKTPRLIAKYIDQMKSDAKRIADLNKKLQTAVDETAEARREADDAHAKLVAAEQSAHVKLAAAEQSAAELKKQSNDLHNSIAAVGAELLATGAALSQAQDEIKLIRAVHEAEAVVARENADILDKLEPQIEGIQLAKQDLSKILDSVRDRLKRKDLEAERAILNRKVLAGVRPDLNRR